MKRQQLCHHYPMHTQYRDGIGHRPEVKSEPVSFMGLMGFLLMYAFATGVLLFFGLCWIDAILSFKGLRP